MLENEFKYYIDNQDTFVKKYNGKYLVIKNNSVVGAFNSEKDAYFNSIEKFELGTFLIQKCTPGDEAYTQHFYTPRVVFA